MAGKTAYIRFFADIGEQSVKKLTGAVEQKLTEDYAKFVILISSGGGTVFHGISAYNFLKGIPAEIWTHNFGSVDSIGVVMFCAGSRRMSVPHARFLIHGVQSQFQERTSLEEPQLQERLDGLKKNIENIAGIIAANTGRTEKQVTQDMLDRIVLNPEEAMKYGLVQEIKEELLPRGAELISI